MSNPYPAGEETPAVTPPPHASPDVPPVARGACGGRMKGGRTCSRPALPGGSHCHMHDHEAASRRGRAGRLAQVAAYQEQRAIRSLEKIPLETLADARAALERALARVEASSGDVVAKANCVARLVTAAMAVTQAADNGAAVASTIADLRAKGWIQ